MSLTLREKCQPVLDQYGLQNYHIEIEPNRGMEICGECGQRLVKVKGVTFSKSSPTLKEMEYSIELLDSFLIKHITILKRMMAQKEISRGLEQVEHEGFSLGRYSNGVEVTYSPDKKYSITFNEDGTVAVNITFPSVKEANSFKITKDIEKKIKEIADSRNKIIESNKLLQELNSELNQCSI